jgi:hypothetical protein
VRPDPLLEALSRGRNDIQFFSKFFLQRTLHDGQLEFLENAEATVNALATANRYGKTTLLLNLHAHGQVYKRGGEARYTDELGVVDPGKFRRLRYETIHTGKDTEEAYAVWDEAHRIKAESPAFDAFIKNAPLSKPPHIDFITGGRWKFRTLGHDASNIDGRSFYIISIDEAGWIDDLDEKMQNVVRVRVADVRGRIVIVGTFKPGISKDFYATCVRASANTGRAIGFDHRSADGEEISDETLDTSIKKYIREFVRREAARGQDRLNDELWTELAKLGITPDEFADVVAA